MRYSWRKLGTKEVIAEEGQGTGKVLNNIEIKGRSIDEKSYKEVVLQGKNNDKGGKGVNSRLPRNKES